MQRLILCFLLFGVLIVSPFGLHAQVYCTASNQAECQSHLQALSALPDLADQDMGNIAIVVGRRFMGLPYVASTLEVPGEEQLVIELQGLDCTTFLENVVVLSRLVKRQELTFAAFQQELTQLRYRDGVLAGYPSRLHYFSDWLWDNEQKGIIRNLSQDLGGIPLDKTINFMSTHPQAYAQLRDGQAVPQIRAIEDSLNHRSLYYLPKARVAEWESHIADGDLVAITTSISGLDVSHVGMAIHHQGRLHLLHASTGQNKVVISTKPLADYLAGNRSQTGIMVARLQ